MGPQVIPTGVCGNLPQGTVCLLVGRSNLTLTALQVFPNVMLVIQGRSRLWFSLLKTQFKSPDSHIAQMIIFALAKMGKSINTERGSESLGCSDTYGVCQIKQDHPRWDGSLKEKHMKALDPGADVSVSAQCHWPVAWPLDLVSTDLLGVGSIPYPAEALDC